MKNRNLLYLGGAAVVIVAVLAYVIFGVLLRAPEAASGPIQAIPLATSAPAAATGAPAAAEATAAPAADATAPASGEATAAPAAASGGQLLFQIVPDQSEARFKLTEELRGAPTNVVGTTDQVAGQIEINPNDLSATKLGTIQINARTLATDSSQRNRAINNFILNTSSFEFITFKPTAVSGLSGSAALGQTYSFEITGDLTIKDVTKSVVFKATATPETEQKLSGTASTVINRDDYGLTIPNVPFVANVSQDVTLELDFVAAPTS